MSSLRALPTEQRSWPLAALAVAESSRLGFRRCGGGGFFDTDGVGPFGDEGVSFFHRHPGILHKHLRAFASAPGEIAQEMGSADAMGTGWGIDFGLAAVDHTSEVVHRVLQLRGIVCRMEGVIINLDVSAPFR